MKAMKASPVRLKPMGKKESREYEAKKKAVLKKRQEAEYLKQLERIHDDMQKEKVKEKERQQAAESSEHMNMFKEDRSWRDRQWMRFSSMRNGAFLRLLGDRQWKSLPDHFSSGTSGSSSTSDTSSSSETSSESSSDSSSMNSQVPDRMMEDVQRNT